MDYKTCKVCGTLKPLSDFYQKDNTCKVCRKEKINLYRKHNIEKIRLYDVERAKLPHRKQQTIENTRKRRKDPDGYMHAHNAVARAVKSGKLERMPCQMCGKTEKVHAHHDDYSKPLEVMWLCVVHHKARHAFLDYINDDVF